MVPGHPETTREGACPTIVELETVAAQGWRAPEEAPLGRWLLRAARGFTGRANSALAAGDPGMPLAEAVTGVCDWYAARGLTAVEVHPDHRRTGLASAITAALAGAAARHGAGSLYLQVEADNEAARALYRRSGFTDHHGYHYRIAPPTG